jgi:hypothetical protein
MAVGGIVEIFLGVKAEGRQLEDIATPLTAQESGRRPRGGQRRFRPGPGSHGSSPGMAVSGQTPSVRLDREIARISAALERGTLDRAELARVVGARSWGPGRFSAALGEALREGRVRRAGRGRFAAGRDQAPG